MGKKKKQKISVYGDNKQYVDEANAVIRGNSWGWNDYNDKVRPDGGNKDKLPIKGQNNKPSPAASPANNKPVVNVPVNNTASSTSVSKPAKTNVASAANDIKKPGNSIGQATVSVKKKTNKV